MAPKQLRPALTTLTLRTLDAHSSDDPGGRDPTKQEARHEAVKRRKRARRWLVQTSPLAFDPANPKPLKIGIHRDIGLMRPDWLSRTQMRLAFGWWVRTDKYRQARAAGAERIGIDGMASGVVTEAEVR